MLKQPKGLIAAALANTGERFGFYTMMAILTLFLMSKFGIDGEQAGKIYSFFYTSIYILALVGGLIADRLRNYKGTIIAGILVMTAGYAALMVPTVTSKTVVIGALMVMAPAPVLTYKLAAAVPCWRTAPVPEIVHKVAAPLRRPKVSRLFAPNAVVAVAPVLRRALIVREPVKVCEAPCV